MNSATGRQRRRFFPFVLAFGCCFDGPIRAFSFQKTFQLHCTRCFARYHDLRGTLHALVSNSASDSKMEDGSPPPPASPPPPPPPIRLNKVFKATHSRRQADELISSGRVTVNGRPVSEKGGIFVRPYLDSIYLDGVLVTGWEALNSIPSLESEPQQSEEIISSKFIPFEYIKYWKPSGVICTTDRSIAENILDAVESDGYRPKFRVYPIGRLDKDTSGLILITNDGRLPNALLRSKQRKSKIYMVSTDRPLQPCDVDLLRHGVVITTVAQRDYKVKPLTAKTLPCEVIRMGPREVQMTLYEGRNRQIRKMMEAIGYRVVKLHRISFCGIELQPLNKPGAWTTLNTKELRIISEVLETVSEH